MSGVREHLPDTAAVQLDTQIWSCSDCMRKMEAPEFPVWVRGGWTHALPHLSEEILATDGCWERKTKVSSETWPLSHICPIPMHIQAALDGLVCVHVCMGVCRESE